jgi:hypothetical protein
VSIATEVQDILQDVFGDTLKDAGLPTEVSDTLQEVFSDVLVAEGIGTTAVYHSAHVGQTYDPETGDYTAATGTAPTYTAPSAAGIAVVATYYSAATQASQTYDPETGDYEAQGPGDGALWFDDEDNSHWIGAI